MSIRHFSPCFHCVSLFNSLFRTHSPPKLTPVTMPFTPLKPVSPCACPTMTHRPGRVFDPSSPQQIGTVVVVDSAAMTPQQQLLFLLFLSILFLVFSQETHWDDEEEMRIRLANITRQQFSHDYHLWPNVRKKRDGGIVSGPIATAVVTGMIGMTARTVQELTNFHPATSSGGCQWFGTAPLCNFPCPPEYDLIRSHTGRCSNWWMAGFCVPDDSFGKPCSTVLGDYFHKRFCCKSDPMECSWSGRWMGANTAHNIYCRYDNVGNCGAVDCSINHFNYKANNYSLVTGDRCDRIELFGLKGKATCGYIAWFNEEGEIVNSWYKTK